MKKTIIILLLLFVETWAFAQENDYDYLLHKIRNNYAGYFDKTTNKKFDLLIKQISKDERGDTFKILSRIVDHFQDQHLQFYAIDVLKDGTIDSIACRNNSLRIERFFATPKKREDLHEGYWVNDQQTIIMAVLHNLHGEYEGYVIKSNSNRVPAGFMIARFKKIKNENFLVDFIGVKSGNRAFLKSTFNGDSILTTGDIAKWTKTDLHTALELLNNKVPEIKVSGQQLDSNNYLLTIPDFKMPNNLIVDSIIKVDSQKIVSSKNLIIDIRNNTGGRVAGYAPLFPFIYTNPIATVGGYTRCSDDLIKETKGELRSYSEDSPLDSVGIESIKEELANLEKHRGGFYFENGDTIRLNNIMPNPQNVAIITNYACESVAEMMLLDFKQSKKVKIFGEHTMGVVDYLDTEGVTLPSGDYRLVYATAKRYIPKGQKKLDGIGIYPDIPISAKILDKDWVRFVKRYYEKK